MSTTTKVRNSTHHQSKKQVLRGELIGDIYKLEDAMGAFKNIPGATRTLGFLMESIEYQIQALEQ